MSEALFRSTRTPVAGAVPTNDFSLVMYRALSAAVTVWYQHLKLSSWVEPPSSSWNVFIDFNSLTPSTVTVPLFELWFTCLSGTWISSASQLVLLLVLLERSRRAGVHLDTV